MKITAAFEYSVRVLVQLSRLPPDHFASVRSLASAEGVSRDFIEQIMLQMRRAGLVESFRGVKGGYSLALQASEISLLDVARAVYGSVFHSPCQYVKDCGTEPEGCGLFEVWSGLGARIEALFA